MKYQRCLLKLSGAAFVGADSFFDFQFASKVIQQLKVLRDQRKELIIVLGAGNICRARTFLPYLLPKSQISLDYSGMLGTVINGLFLKECFTKAGMQVGMMSSIGIDYQIAHPYNFDLANKMLHEYGILILVGGIGTPNFSTDFTAVLKAKELNAEVVLFGKNDIDGIYSADPRSNKDARFIAKLTFYEVVSQKLEFIDLSAAAFNINEKIDLLVFNINKPNAVLNVLEGKGKYSIVSND